MTEADRRPPIRVGIVGSGLMGAMHSGAYRRLGLLDDGARFELVRVVGRNEATNHALAARFGWAETAQDWRRATAAHDIDLVDICTPEDTHCEIAAHALANGKHVFCEKPLAATEREARQMCRAADATDKVSMTGFVLRAWPALRRAREMVKQGAVGEPRRVVARYLIDSQTLLESSLRGLGSHLLDAATWLVGPIAQICSVSRQVTEEPSIDAATLAMIRFSSGCVGTLELDREARGRVMDLELSVEGTLGGLGLAWRRREELALTLGAGGPADGPHEVTIRAEDPPPLALFHGAGFGLDALFVAQAERLAAVIEGRPLDYPDFIAGWHAAAVGEAAISSWDSGTWVELAELDRDQRSSGD